MAAKNSQQSWNLETLENRQLLSAAAVTPAVPALVAPLAVAPTSILGSWVGTSTTVHSRVIQTMTLTVASQNRHNVIAGNGVTYTPHDRTPMTWTITGTFSGTTLTATIHNAAGETISLRGVVTNGIFNGDWNGGAYGSGTVHLTRPVPA